MLCRRYTGVVLTAQSPQAIQLLLDKVDTVSKEFVVEISTKKTKVMALKSMTEVIHIFCNGVELEQVEYFKHLVPLLHKMEIVVKKTIHAWVWLEI